MRPESFSEPSQPCNSNSIKFSINSKVLRFNPSNNGQLPLLKISHPSSLILLSPNLRIQILKIKVSKFFHEAVIKYWHPSWVIELPAISLKRYSKKSFKFFATDPFWENSSLHLEYYCNLFTERIPRSRYWRQGISHFLIY